MQQPLPPPPHHSSSSSDPYQTKFPGKLLAVLRDGRHLVGILRSFDQFSNVVLEQCVERRHVGQVFCDEPVGLFLLRGDQIVLLGDIVDDRFEETHQFVSLEEFRALVSASPEARNELKSISDKWNFDKA